MKPSGCATTNFRATLLFTVLVGIVPSPALAVNYATAPADLVASLSAPKLMVGAEATMTVTVHNQGVAHAPTPWIRFYMNLAGNVERKWGTLLRATNADCTQSDRQIDCQLRDTFAGGVSKQIALTLRADNVGPSDRHQFHIHADCGPVATHHNGGLIPESNESNNVTVAHVTIHRPPDLIPTGMASSSEDYASKYVHKSSNTTLKFFVRQQERFVSASQVNVSVSVPNIDVQNAIALVFDKDGRSLGSGGFVCTWSNSTRQIICRGGSLGEESYVMIEAVVRAPLTAPTGDSPVIVTADPEKRVQEWDETNNMKTFTVRIR